MRITHRQLRQIIREEVTRSLIRESSDLDRVFTGTFPNPYGGNSYFSYRITKTGPAGVPTSATASGYVEAVVPDSVESLTIDASAKIGVMPGKGIYRDEPYFNVSFGPGSSTERVTSVGAQSLGTRVTLDLELETINGVLTTSVYIGLCDTPDLMVEILRTV